MNAGLGGSFESYRRGVPLHFRWLGQKTHICFLYKSFKSHTQCTCIICIHTCIHVCQLKRTYHKLSVENIKHDSGKAVTYHERLIIKRGHLSYVTVIGHLYIFLLFIDLKRSDWLFTFPMTKRSCVSGGSVLLAGTTGTQPRWTVREINNHSTIFTLLIVQLFEDKFQSPYSQYSIILLAKCRNKMHT